MSEFCDTCIRVRTLARPVPCRDCLGYRAKGEM